MMDYSQISHFSLHNEKHPSVSPLKGRIGNVPLRGLQVCFITEIYIAHFFSDDSNFKWYKI